MKKSLFILLVALIMQTGIAQTNKTIPKGELVYSLAELDKQPEFPGGMREFYNYIAKNFKKPNVKNLKGRVFIEFVIYKDGSIRDVKLLRDLGYGTGQEAIRLMDNCPDWIPGEFNGEKINAKYSLPIAIDII